MLRHGIGEAGKDFRFRRLISKQYKEDKKEYRLKQYSQNRMEFLKRQEYS